MKRMAFAFVAAAIIALALVLGINAKQDGRGAQNKNISILTDENLELHNQNSITIDSNQEINLDDIKGKLEVNFE